MPPGAQTRRPKHAVASGLHAELSWGTGASPLRRVSDLWGVEVVLRAIR